MSLDRIRDFVAAHARLLDRRRLDLALGAGDPDATLQVLAGYRNPDGGFGWGLEPDSRAPGSQPVAALHAMEVFEEVAPTASPMATDLLDWLDATALTGGAIPFGLDVGTTAGSAPMWASADPTTPSLHMTAVVLSIAHRVPAVAGHPWLHRATDWALQKIAAMEKPGHAIELRYVLALLDALEATDELERLWAHVPHDGTLPVSGGKPDEAMRPLDFSPEPDRPIRRLLPPEVIEADLDRLAAEQHDDGGWDVDWEHWSPMGGLEWRGWATVRAVKILRANGRL